MRMLVDFHHHALAESLLRLFEDRWGVDVYFPLGMDWFESETWNFERVWHGDAVARQYLEGIWGEPVTMNGVALRADPRHPGRTHRGITYEAALERQWDIVLSTLPHNDEGFHRFAGLTDARFGVQVGNHMQDSRWDLASFVLSSSTLPGHTSSQSFARELTWNGLPTVIYHQEFDAHGVFYSDPVPAMGSREVASWVNCFPETQPYPSFLALARDTAADFDWKVFGAYGTAPTDELAAGDVSDVTDVAQRMRKARIGMHMKSWSDGFGHVIHNWAAVGRPIIWVADYYRDKLAAPLWEHGVNAWDIGQMTRHETIEVMRRLRDDDDMWLAACEAARRRFEEVVDFDHEAEVIGRMLGL